MSGVRTQVNRESGDVRQRYDALVTLLERPDLPCLPARKRSYRFPGDPIRREHIKRDLARAYAEHRACEYWNRDGEIVSVRRSLAVRQS